MMHSVLLSLFFLTASAITMQEPDDLASVQQVPDTDIMQWAGYGEERLSSVLVTGTVLCEACLDGETRVGSQPVSGALVAVTCKAEGKRMRKTTAKSTTDEYGDFMVDLPSSLHAIPRLERSCFVRVLQLPENTVCRLIIARKPARMKLSSVGNGIRVYTAGFLRIKQNAHDVQICAERRKHEENKSW